MSLSASALNEASQRLYETGTASFDNKGQFDDFDVEEPPAAATSPSKPRMRNAHKTTVLVEGDAASLAAYKVDEPQPSSPLRVVVHRDGNGNLEQKQNPDRTAPGRIRNVAGGTFNS